MSVCFQLVHAVQQICVFDEPNRNINTVDGPTKNYWRCYVDNVKVLAGNELVTTITTANTKQKTDVTQFLYNTGCVIKFIPNSIFIDFPNIEYLYIYENQQFEEMKPEYLKNATKLITFRIHKNIISKLDANIFVEAPTLEHINLFGNKIETIHYLAFSGLPNLQNIYLNENKITNLHPNTFTYIRHIQTLNLLTNTCIDKKFSNASHENTVISGEIGKACKFAAWSIDNVLEITVAKEKLADMRILSLFNYFDEMKSNLTEANALAKTLTDKILKLEGNESTNKKEHVEKNSADSDAYSKFMKNMMTMIRN